MVTHTLIKYVVSWFTSDALGQLSAEVGFEDAAHRIYQDKANSHRGVRLVRVTNELVEGSERITQEVLIEPVKTNDLSGHALDWAVTNKAGYLTHVDHDKIEEIPSGIRSEHVYWDTEAGLALQMDCQFSASGQDHPHQIACSFFHSPDKRVIGIGPTSGIAASRCMLLWKVGPEVGVPGEIVHAL